MTIELDLWLEPGDYLLQLRPVQPSEGTCELTSERLDPFDLEADQEPNDIRGLARPVSSTLRWRGTARHDRDFGWYQLLPLEAPAQVVASLGAERAILRLYAGGERLDLQQDPDGRLVAAGVPAGVPIFVEIEASSPYEVSIETDGWMPRPKPAESVEPSVDLALQLETDIVAAYWPESQRVEGVLTLTNTGSDDLELDLVAVTQPLCMGGRACHRSHGRPRRWHRAHPYQRAHPTGCLGRRPGSDQRGCPDNAGWPDVCFSRCRGNA